VLGWGQIYWKKLWIHLGGLGLLYTGVMDYCGEEIIIVWRVEGIVAWIGWAYCFVLGGSQFTTSFQQ